MNVIDTTKPSQSDAISFELDLAHLPEKVWRAITDPVLLHEWLLPVVGLSLEVGSAFAFKAPAFPGWDGTVNCKVLEIDAPKTLTYAWVVGDMELDTVVSFTLTPTTKGTRLSLVQSGFKPSQKQNFGGARYGWKTMSGKLAALLDTI